MKVNGKTRELQKQMSLRQFLSEQGYNCDRIAIELNGQIIPKADYQNTVLSDKDTLEIVHFVGGG